MSNSMFKQDENFCLTKNNCLNVRLVMHLTMTRVYKAAKDLRGLEGQTNLANYLRESPQVVKNWESRGISQQGMIKVHELIGCSIDYIKGHTDALASNKSLQQTASTYEVKPAVAVAGMKIKSNEAILLEHYKKLSNQSQQTIDLLLNRLYELEHPNDLVANPTNGKIKKKERETQ